MVRWAEISTPGAGWCMRSSNERLDVTTILTGTRWLLISCVGWRRRRPRAATVVQPASGLRHGSLWRRRQAPRTSAFFFFLSRTISKQDSTTIISNNQRGGGMERRATGWDGAPSTNADANARGTNRQSASCRGREIRSRLRRGEYPRDAIGEGSKPQAAGPGGRGDPSSAFQAKLKPAMHGFPFSLHLSRKYVLQHAHAQHVALVPCACISSIALQQKPRAWRRSRQWHEQKKDRVSRRALE